MCMGSVQLARAKVNTLDATLPGDRSKLVGGGCYGKVRIWDRDVGELVAHAGDGRDKLAMPPERLFLGQRGVMSSLTDLSFLLILSWK